MDRELARRTTSHVMPARPLPRREVMIASTYERVALVREIRRLARVGEILKSQPVVATRDGWKVEVIRIKERPRIRPWVWKFSLGAGLGLVFLAALVLLLRALYVAFMAVLPVALAGLAIMFIASLLRGGGAVTVTQIVKIKR